MVDVDERQAVYQAFPFLRDASPALRNAFFAQAARAELGADQFICMEGRVCGHLPLVLSGTARVYKIGESGHEITLYRIAPGESCILTASCILSERAFPAFAMAETDVEALVISTGLFRTWFDAYPAWRTYIFDLLARRFASVIELVEEVAFERMDKRLASYLLASAADEDVLSRTHEAIAYDLGTSREVISRILKDFEHRGWVALSRGAVRLVDTEALGQAV